MSTENLNEENVEPIKESIPEALEQFTSELKQEEVPVEQFNSYQRYTYFKTDKEVSKAIYSFKLPSVPLTVLNKKLSDQQNLDIDEKDVKYKEWKEATEEALEYYTPFSLYQNCFTDKTRSFKQGVEKDDQLKSISDFKFKKTEGEIKGELALLKVSKLLGLGDVVSVPLPHSGISVTIKPPTEKDLIDFYNIIFREKAILGRATSGLTLSNFSVFVNSKVLEFIIKHVHSVNYSDINKSDLGNYIVIHDLPILAWGFAASVYPNGFNFKRSCVEDLSKCNHVLSGLVDVKKLLWVDNTAFTSVQKDIYFEDRPNKHTLEVYRKYKAEHTRVKSQSFTTGNGLKFYLRLPTLNEYFSDGLSWVNKINNAVENVILESSEKEEDAKRELLTQYVKSSSLRQYSHFIDYIEVDESVINDRETVNSVLEALSSDDSLRTDILEKLHKFIADTTIAVVGIPEYKCPNCGKEQQVDTINERFVNVIPLDTINLFFGLITLRIAKITERAI